MSRVTAQDVKKCRDLFDAIPRSTGKYLPVYDGIVDLKKYNDSKYKILWILKEPSRTTGEWDVCKDYFNNKKFEEYKKWKATIGPLIQVTYGILHELPEWKKLPKIDDISSIVEHIAFIHLKKVPGRPKSDRATVHQTYKRPETQKLIQCQIETYKPDIILGGENNAHPLSLLQYCCFRYS